MARYRKIDPRVWNDSKFRAFSDNGKLAFLMLLTHPSMTSLGAMRATLAGLGEELGWSTEAFREAFLEAQAKGMVEHDPKACLIALPNFVRYNPPESPNVVKAWVGALDLLPECSLKARVVARAKGFAEGMGKGFGEAFAEGFAKSMAYQEPEQEPEQELLPTPTPPKKSSNAPTSFKTWIASLKDRGEKPIQPDDPIFDYCASVGIPESYLTLHWLLFKHRYLDVSKRYRDWRKVFRNSVRGNWMHVWALREGQDAMLTTVGEAARREFEHKEAA